MLILRRTPTPRLLARAASALAVCFFGIAAPLHAQYDGGDTRAAVSPESNTFTRPTVAVTVTFYDNASLDTTTRSIIFNGAPVEDSFSYGPIETGGGLGGEVSTSASGTLTLAPGENTLWASICDNTACGDTTRVTYVYVPGRPAVQVRPDGGTATAGASVPSVHAFRVVNAGPVPGTYTLRPECRDAWTGARVAGCTASAASVTVGAGDSVSVTVTAPGGAAGAARLVRLSAELASMPGVSDAGWVDVTSVGAAGSTQVAPQVAAVALTPGAAVDRSECVTVAVAPGTAYECGDVRMVHALPPHATYNRGWAPAMLYNSQHAHPRPILYADVTVPAGAAVPASVQVVGTVAGIAWTVTYAGAEFTPGVARRVAVQVDGSGWSTGVYPYVLQVTANYPSGSYPSAALTGEIPIVNRANSPFGPGWWMAGLEQLICIGCSTGGARMLWIGGDGSTRVYEPLAWWQTWVAQNPGGAPDTLTLVNYSHYVRKLPGGGRVELGGVGQHLRTVNRLGQATHFYTQDSGVPDSIHAPVPAGQGARSWVFVWGTGLTEVRARAPGGADRVVQFGHPPGDVRITSITDPDSAVTGITYGTGAGATAVPVAVTDRRGTRHALGYDAAWKLASARLYMDGASPGPNDLVRGFQAGESRGVGTSVPVAQAYTLLDGPRTDVADHTMLWLTAQGAPRRIRDPLGAETVLQRADTRFPALVTGVLGPTARGDSMVTKSTAVYDARGRVTRSRVSNPLGDGKHIDQWYTYDDRWDRPDTVTAVGVGEIFMAYDTLNGNLLWRQQGGTSRRVTYGYYPSGQLARVRHPANAQGVVARDTMGYDAVGNLAWTRTPLGYLTQHYRDALGRDTLVLSPIRADSSFTVAQLQVAGLHSRTAYDLSGRVWMTETAGPETRIEWQGITASTKLSKVHAQSVTTRTTYDRGGLPLTVERWTLPDTADINVVTTQYVYDRAGRKRAEKEGLGAWEYFTPDAAGNVVTWTTGRGHEIKTEYDALGRQVRRTVPAVSYDAAPQPCWAAHFNDCPFPHFPNNGSGYLVPADTSVFAYDAAGNLVFAANADAVVSRSYYPGGALRTDSLRIATFGAGNFTQHVYGLTHRYDAQGRLRALEHPASLTGGVAQADSFAYTTATGALARVVSRTGLQFSFRYDFLGRMVQDSFPGGENTYVYDLDGRRKSRAGTVYHDSTRYDARGKALLSWVNGLPGQSTFYNHYSGLGNLVGTDWTNVSNAARNVEEMIVDGLGNVRWKRTANDQTAVAPEHWYTYNPGSTRLQDILFSMPSNPHDPGAYHPDDTHRTYDAGGNAYRGSTIVGANSTGAGYSRTYTASYFSADERLRAYQHNHEIEPTRLNGHAKRGSFAEYFYDPLGRRIQVRTRRDGLCYAGANAGTVDCSSGIERYVWAGDNILWEMRGPGANTATPEQLNEVGSGGDPYGVVGYTHAGGVDRPLVAWKGEGSSPVTVVVPHLNWRGLFGKGTDAYGNPSGAEIEWPGFQTTASHSRAPTQMPTLTWFGSVLEGQRDAGGQMYMRNRYYDPATGQFTQTDPIGIAGGLNTYGFANGDPVTYSDPYGLRANCNPPRPDCINPWEYFKNDVLRLRSLPMHDNSARRGQLYGVASVDAGTHAGSGQTNASPKVEKNHGGVPQGGAQVGLGVEYSEADSNETEFTIGVGALSVDVAEGPQGARVTSVEAKVEVGPQAPRAPVSVTTTEPIRPIRNSFTCAKTGIGC